MERWQRNPVFKTLQTNPSEVEYADVSTYKTKVMQNKYCVEATKEFKVNHFGNVTIEESSPPLNREILKMYSSIVWFCQISKGIPKENSNRSQEFFSDKVCSSSKAVPPVICQASLSLLLQCQHTLPSWTAQVSTAAALKDQSASKCQCSHVLSCAWSFSLEPLAFGPLYGRMDLGGFLPSKLLLWPWVMSPLNSAPWEGWCSLVNGRKL